MAASARIISGKQVRTLLTMAEAIEVNAAAFQQHHRGRIVNPDRLIMAVKSSDSVATVGHTLVKPAHVLESGALGVKVVSVFPGNAERALPTVPGTIVVLDPRTGCLKGLVDGTSVTALRTAAGSGAATRALCSPSASVCVIFGAGAQAAAHVCAMACVRKIDKLVVIARSAAAGDALLASTRQYLPDSCSLSCVPLSDTSAVRAAVSSAHILCTCTASSAPLFDGSWLSPGVHINAVGSYQPDAAELDTATIARARVILDTDAAAECGEIAGNLASGAIRLESHVAGTLGALLCGDIRDERLSATAAQDITVFKSVGVAFQDVATAAALLDKAETVGAGIQIDME